MDNRSQTHETRDWSDVNNSYNVQELAREYTIFKIGHVLYDFYFPVFIPIGIIGNILSFAVMVQPHNRHSAMSLYLSSIAVVDTVVLIVGLLTYLSNVHTVHFPPDFYWFCTIGNFILFAAFLCSTLFILSMTFDRFYSIIRPHKAASFNTVKRAKITVVCILMFSIVYNIPHLFISSINGRQCLPYGSGKRWGEFYYWLSFVINYTLPFVLLLAMNSVIIHTLRTRLKFTTSTLSVGQGQSKGQSQSKSQGQNEGQSGTKKNTEKQIFATLLLVTFGFLVLTTPTTVLFLLIMTYDFEQSPAVFAGYYLFYNIAQKLYYTNNGINFFLYVLSGQKFRQDLVNLFKCCRKGDNSFSGDSDTRNTSI